ncbi:MAG: cell division protein SepF [Actinobacteria bacterium]|nr:cell division protein SepF [Actinomycetota bacterium]
MAGGGIWHKTLVYFGLADEDDEYDDETLSIGPDVEPTYRERPNVRKIDRSSRRRQAAEFDDIFAEEEYRSPRGGSLQRGANIRSLPTAVEQPQVRVHLVMPKNFNDAQTIADKFKGDIPVILNLQSSETELAKRLIDFASGLTYALDGGMQRVADKVFLLTPKNVEVSAEERQRLMEKGFFNQF